MSAKLYEVNKFISLSGHKWEVTPFLMSQISVKKVKPEELTIIKAAAKEPALLQRKLMIETDQKLLTDFKANANLVVNECDGSAFQAATAEVVEKWKAKPFGEFVSKLVGRRKELRTMELKPPLRALMRLRNKGTSKDARVAKEIDRLITRICRFVVLVTVSP